MELLADLKQSRAGHAAILLDDGRLMVAGGRSDRGSVLATTEIYDPNSNSWEPGPRMFDARSDFAWTRLRTGAILVTGGRGPASDLAEAEIYDQAGRRWFRIRPMTYPRSQHGVAVLSNGDAVFCGGVSSATALSSCESYRYGDGTWSRIAPMSQGRYAHTFVSLGERGLLAAGGRASPTTVIASAEIWTEDEGWRPTGSMNQARGEHATLLLGDGRVLVAGGAGSKSRGFPTHSETFDPASGRWTQGAALKPRARPAATLWNDKPVLVGGYFISQLDPYSYLGYMNSVDYVEYFDESRDAWLTLPDLAVVAASALSATALPDGRLLLAGGEDQGTHGSYSGWLPSNEVKAISGDSLKELVPPGNPVASLPAQKGPRAKPRRPVRPDDLAVVVGVERYRTLPVASYAENDARSVEEALRDIGVPEENIVLLNGSRAGLSELAKYFEEWLPLHAKESSRVYVFFSGHGAPDIASSVPYLMPWDGDATFVKSTGYPLSKLYAKLEELPAKEVIVALDSCFTGVGDRSVLAPGLRPLATVRMPAAARGRISVLSASAANEAAGSLPSSGHGAFTHHLVKGLAGDADGDTDGHLTLAELHAYVRKRVILDARSQRREQTPTLSSPEPSLKLY